MSGDVINRHYEGPRLKLHDPDDATFPIPSEMRRRRHTERHTDNVSEDTSND